MLMFKITKEKTAKTIHYLMVALLLSTVFIFCVLNHQKGHDWGDDFALYINQARALVDGTIEETLFVNAYTLEKSTYQPLGPVAYPWSFPVLLSPLYAAFGLSYPIFKLYETIFFILGLSSLYLLFKERFSRIYNLLLVSLIGSNIPYILYTNTVTTEIPYLFFSLLTLYLINKTYNKENIIVANFLSGLRIGFLLLFSFFIRSEGIALLCALTVYQVAMLFVSGKWKQLSIRSAVLLLVPYLTFAVLYVSSKLFLPTGFTSHYTFLEDVSLETSLGNIAFYFTTLKFMAGYTLHIYSFYILSIVFLVGVAARWKEDLLFLSYFTIILTIILIWPFHENRYLFSIIPFYLYFFIQGVRRLSQFFFEKDFAYVLVGLILILNLNALITFTKHTDRNATIDGPETPNSKEMFQYVRDHTYENDIIGFFRARLLTLYTGRRSVVVFDSVKSIKERANYLVINRKTTQFQISPDLIDSQNGFQKVFQNSDFIIFKVTP